MNPLPTRPRHRRLLPLALLLLLPLMAPAATRIWVGGESPFWSHPANWTNGLLPVAADSIEFPAEAKFMDTYNDLEVDATIHSITFKGRNYTLRGNRISLGGNLESIPGNGTNRVLLDLNINAPLSIINHGYFNTLELGGTLYLRWHSLTLETSSTILISGFISNTNNAIEVIQRSPGTLWFGPAGRITGSLHVEEGDLLLSGQSTVQHLSAAYECRLVVGRAVNPGGTARVYWGGNEKLAAKTQVTLHSSGALFLNRYTQAIASLNGAGMVNLDAGQLTLRGSAHASALAGALGGTGTLRLEGVDPGVELGGHNTFTGRVETVASHLKLNGSASNAVVVLTAGATLTGHGVAKALAATNAFVRPGPGTLRFLEGFTLDAGTLLDVVLDGPDAGSVQAGTVNLNQAALQFAYHGVGLEDHFTLVSANSAVAGSLFNGLAEGAWLLAGDPLAPHEFQLTYAGGTGHDVKLRRTGLFLPPMLSIHPLSATERRIEWPIAAQGYTLQHTPNLHLPAWTANGLPAPATTVSAGGQNQPGMGE
jgi:hypothetical protein